MDTTRLRDEWGFRPAWNADECLEDFALAVRGRVTVGRRVVSLPWRMTSIQDLPAVDTPADDGVVPRLAGPREENGEFDTPIDPRFPTYLATNLSEALPGPFSPSSASVTVRGLRAGGVAIAERLRPGGIVQREIAMRTVAVFAHRLYGAITSAHFMAETVPFVKPATIVSNSGFFGPSMASLPIFGEERPPSESDRGRRQLRTVRNIGVFGVNLVGLSAGSPRDTHDFIADVDRLERLAGGDLSTTRRSPATQPDHVGARPRRARLGAGLGVVHAVRRVQRAVARLVWPRHRDVGRAEPGQRAVRGGGAAAGGRGAARPQRDAPAGRTGGASEQAGRRGAGVSRRGAGRAGADRAPRSGRGRDAVDQLRRRPRVAGPDGGQGDGHVPAATPRIHGFRCRPGPLRRWPHVSSATARSAATKWCAPTGCCAVCCANTGAGWSTPASSTPPTTCSTCWSTS